MPDWMIEPSNEEQEEETHPAEQRLATANEVVEYRQECRYWAGEIFKFHEIPSLSSAFNSLLIESILTAAPLNRARLRLGFRVAVEMVEEWERESSSSYFYYLKYDVLPGLARDPTALVQG